MDKSLAKLIKDNGPAIFPYLQLRSEYVLQGRLSEEAAIGLISSQDMDLLCDSQYIVLGDGKVLFESESGWLAESPVKKTTPKQASDFDKQIDRLANIVGMPSDYLTNSGRYRKMYSRLRKNHSFDEIETIAYDNEGVGLNILLSESRFKMMLRQFGKESS